MLRIGHRGVMLGGAVLLAGLVGTALAAVPPASSETITYELSGPREVRSVQYGDIFDVVFDPSVMTDVDHAVLPWRLTVPMNGTPTLHHLSAVAADSVPLTCTVRRGDLVVSTQTAVGKVACVTTPASAAASVPRR